MSREKSLASVNRLGVGRTLLGTMKSARPTALYGSRRTAAYELQADIAVPVLLSVPKRPVVPSASTPSLSPAAHPTSGDEEVDVLTVVEEELAVKGRYEPRGMLGEGGMGTVERERDHALGRDVAVKRVRAKSPAALFLREARITARLEHPNIVPVHDVKESADGRTELVMKIIEGRSLADIIEGLRARDPKLVEEYTTERRVEVFLSLLRALEFAHAEGVVHRDVKPENVMIGLHGEVLLVPHHRQSDRLKLREFCASDE